MSRIPSAHGSRPKAQDDQQHQQQPVGRKAQAATPPARSPHHLRSPHITPPRRAATAETTTAKTNVTPTPPTKQSMIPGAANTPSRLPTPNTTAPPTMMPIVTPPTGATSSGSMASSGIPSATLRATPLTTPGTGATLPTPAAGPAQNVPGITPQRPVNLLHAFTDAADVGVATPPATTPACPQVSPPTVSEAIAVNTAAASQQQQQQQQQQAGSAVEDSQSSAKQEAASRLGEKLYRLLQRRLHTAATCTMACSLGLVWVAEVLRPVNPHQTTFS